MGFDGQTMAPSRVMCIKVYGPPPTPLHECAHSCGKGHEGCVAPRHLRWATPKENQMDRVLHGTDSRGEKSVSAVLRASEVNEIRRRYVWGKGTSLAAEYGVTQATVSAIVRGKTWRNI